jgi:hypothetical protein
MSSSYDRWLEGYHERADDADMRARIREQHDEDDFQRGKDMDAVERSARLEQDIDRLNDR